MSHLPIVLMVVALGALAQGLLLSAISPHLLRAVARIEPALRVRWVLALLASPIASGLFLLMVVYGHCVVELRPGAGLEDGCERLCRLCLWRSPPATPLSAALALVCVAPLLDRVWRVGASLRASRRAVSRLQLVARVRREGLWSVPGALSFVAGWPRGDAYVGEDIGARLGTQAEIAVTAHEVAHVSRGDVTVRLLGRVLSGAHLPWVGAPLVSALDLAIEQACDAEASRVVSDPLIVAHTLIELARLDPGPLAGSAGSFSDAALEERVAALCAPSWGPSDRSAFAFAALSLGVAGAGVALYDPLHHAGEVLVSLLRV